MFLIFPPVLHLLKVVKSRVYKALSGYEYDQYERKLIPSISSTDIQFVSLSVQKGSD